MTTKTKARGGRPRKRAIRPGDRVPFSMRVTPELKRRLDSAAAESGRSLTQEAEIRVQQSFDREDLLRDALHLRFGQFIASALLAIGYAMESAGNAAGREVVPLGEEMRGWWWRIPYAYDRAFREAVDVLEKMRPEGDIATPPNARDVTGFYSDLLLRAVAHRPDAFRSESLQRFADQIREMLGPFAEELRIPAKSPWLRDGKLKP